MPMLRTVEWPSKVLSASSLLSTKPTYLTKYVTTIEYSCAWLSLLPLMATENTPVFKALTVLSCSWRAISPAIGALCPRTCVALRNVRLRKHFAQQRSDVLRCTQRDVVLQQEICEQAFCTYDVAVAVFSTEKLLETMVLLFALKVAGVLIRCNVRSDVNITIAHSAEGIMLPFARRQNAPQL
ncbi:hypothetical protein HPB48_001327 [Haemaphysalis longicornis]|uniref:Uncharacterized protein n=1 Tax=Haemaphysalis longicornis TaxID=44386 RepID=A0A9J6GD64_HAELO|nr:hypothetical protein HPB48_001327 [Haemaphysalis longicornis]